MTVYSIAIALQNATVGGVEHNPITYYETFPWPYPDPLPVYATSNDTTVVDDACNPLGDDTPDLSGFLVLVRRGSCNFVQKLANIAEKGAQIAFIYEYVTSVFIACDLKANMCGIVMLVGLQESTSERTMQVLFKQLTVNS